MGTVTPPAASAAKSAMTHSGLFSERMATRSPGFEAESLEARARDAGPWFRPRPSKGSSRPRPS